MIGNAIHLDEVNGPCRILPGEGIIIGLRGWMRRIKAVVVCVPGAHVRRISSVRRMERRAGDGKIPGYSFPGYATDDVDPKLKPERVQIVGERSEREILSCRREA